jgi:cytochrome P450
MKQPFTVFQEVARRYGDVVDIPQPGKAMTLLSHPDHVHHIMTRDYQNYDKHESLSELLMAGDDALAVMAGGDEWKTWRRALNPHFGEQGLAAVSPLMTAAVEERSAGWARFAGTGEWVDLEHELAIIVADGSLRMMLGAALETDTLLRFLQAARAYGKYTLARGMMYAAPSFVPRPYRKSGEAAETLLLRHMDTMIAERLAAGPCAEPDVLDTLIAMSFRGDPDMRHQKLRAELGGLVIAGFETAAEAVAWTIALLCSHPGDLARVLAEVDAFGGAAVSYEHLAGMPYLRACLDESQRFQSFPVFIRTAAHDDEIDGYAIPKGSDVLVSPYGLHRDPRFWTDPLTFRPQRFITDKINRNAFLQFGVGPHKCMGWHMAYLEGMVTLAAVLQKYSFELQPGWSPRPKVNHVTTGLVGGLPVRISLR